MTAQSDRYIYVRIALCVVCILVTGLAGIVESWTVWVAGTLGITGILAMWTVPHFLMAPLLPGRAWLLVGTAIYVVIWMIIWSIYYRELAQYPDNDRSWMTEALFILANISFAIGLGVRLGVQIGLHVMKRWRSIYGGKAV